MLHEVAAPNNPAYGRRFCACRILFYHLWYVFCELFVKQTIFLSRFVVSCRIYKQKGKNSVSDALFRQKIFKNKSLLFSYYSPHEHRHSPERFAAAGSRKPFSASLFLPYSLYRQLRCIFSVGRRAYRESTVHNLQDSRKKAAAEQNIG